MVPKTTVFPLTQPGQKVVTANQAGPIAESYEKLQAVHLLLELRSKSDIPLSTTPSAIQTVLQASEIAIINLTDLQNRASEDILNGRLGAAVEKLPWINGFHDILISLSQMPHLFDREQEISTGTISVSNSLAFTDFLGSSKKLDASVLGKIPANEIEEALRTGGLSNLTYNLLHNLRLAHEKNNIWARNLNAIPFPSRHLPYENTVNSRLLKSAVYDTNLAGDTFYTQFRGLHQIPELLAFEANEHLKGAAKLINTRNLTQALVHLRTANTLVNGIVVSMPPILSSLATSDYHKIRENLGLTSGSHSQNLNKELFKERYFELSQAVIELVSGSPKPIDEIEARFKAIAGNPKADNNSWNTYLLIKEALELRAHIKHWRALHVNLPKNNLGGNMTKSLVGSPSAIEAVEHMMRIAESKDPLNVVARAFGIEADTDSAYISSDLETTLLALTGKITQERFPDVQYRTGFFAHSQAKEE